MSETQELTFVKHLKEQTIVTHDSVDNLVMFVQPFVSKESYIEFSELQSTFHKAVDHIYKDTELNKAIPELEYMTRYNTVTQNLRDSGEEPYKFGKELPHGTDNRAIGWFYYAEGLNLGAAFLFKHARKLEYNGEHGACHLAPHPSGRGEHWRAFIEHLNAPNLTPETEAEAIRGVQEAFAFYKVTLHETFGLPEGIEAPESMTPHRH